MIATNHGPGCICGLCNNFTYKDWPRLTPSQSTSTFTFPSVNTSCNCKEKISVLEIKIEALLLKLDAHQIKINELVNHVLPLQEEPESAKKEILSALEFIKNQLEEMEGGE